MIGLRRWFLVFLGWLAIAAVAGGEELRGGPADGEMPPPPGVSDRAGLFLRKPEALQRISERIGKLEADHGFRLYLVLESVMISGTPPDLAARLQHAWLPEGNGFVVVYEVDSRLMGAGVGMLGDADLGGDGRVPSYEVMNILSKAMEATDESQPAELYVELLAEALAAGFDDYFARRKVPAPPGRSLRFGLIAAGTLAILALAVLGMAWVLRRSGTDAPRRFRFPEAEVPERLGAPSGGGDVTSRRFGRNDSDVPR